MIRPKLRNAPNATWAQSLRSAMRRRMILLIFGLMFLHQHLLSNPPSAHPGWQIVSGAADLIDNAYWDTLSYNNRPDASVSVTSGTLTVVAGNDYLSGFNIYAPQLNVSGDFGIAATLNVSTNGSAWLELAGSLTTGPSYWNNQKYIAVGLNQ